MGVNLTAAIFLGLLAASTALLQVSLAGDPPTTAQPRAAASVAGQVSSAAGNLPAPTSADLEQLADEESAADDEGAADEEDADFWARLNSVELEDELRFNRDFRDLREGEADADEADADEDDDAGTIEIEPSEFALNDETYDENFDYDEQGKIVGDDQKSSQKH